MSAKYATPTCHNLSVVLASKNSVQWEKVVVSSAFNSNSRAGAFPPDNYCTGHIALVSFAWFPFYDNLLKRCVLRDGDQIKLMIFTALIKHIIK